MLSVELRNPHGPGAGTRFDAIDELKGWAILLVMLYHAGGVLGWANFLHGECGVDIFLMVSGFALTLNSTRISGGQFFLRRVLRIYPSYWIVMGIYLWLNARFFAAHPSTTSLWLHFLGLHGFGSGEYFSQINDSFWFISLILLLYFVFFGLRKRLSELALVVGFGLVLTTAACLLYIRADHNGGLIQLGVRLPSFFIGLVAGQLAVGGGGTFRLDHWLLAVGLIAMTFLGWQFGIITFYAIAGSGMAVGFLWVRSVIKKITPGRWLLKVFAFLGVYSYEIYLIHQPLFRDYNYLYYHLHLHIEPTRNQLALGMGVALVISLVVGGLLHVLTTRLFRWFSRRETIPIAPALSA